MNWLGLQAPSRPRHRAACPPGTSNTLPPDLNPLKAGLHRDRSRRRLNTLECSPACLISPYNSGDVQPAPYCFGQAKRDVQLEPAFSHFHKLLCNQGWRQWEEAEALVERRNQRANNLGKIVRDPSDFDSRLGRIFILPTDIVLEYPPSVANRRQQTPGKPIPPRPEKHPQVTIWS